jgi:hypothetical protein
MLLLHLHLLNPVAIVLAWTPVRSTYKVDHEVVPESAVLAFNSSPDVGMVPIRTGKLSQGSGLSANFVNTSEQAVQALRFMLTDEKAGGKSRIEATTCYATNSTLRANGLVPGSREAQMLIALNFLNQNCTNAYQSPQGAEGVVETNVSYTLRLPENLTSEKCSVKSKGILYLCYASW